MIKNTGGPAFPRAGNEWDEMDWVPSHSENGMTLRDYFAAKAMQGLLSNPKLANEIIKHGGADGGWIESSAYGWSDRMLKARSE